MYTHRVFWLCVCCCCCYWYALQLLLLWLLLLLLLMVFFTNTDLRRAAVAPITASRHARRNRALGGEGLPHFPEFVFPGEVLPVRRPNRRVMAVGDVIECGELCDPRRGEETGWPTAVLCARSMCYRYSAAECGFNGCPRTYCACSIFYCIIGIILYTHRHDAPETVWIILALFVL